MEWLVYGIIIVIGWILGNIAHDLGHYFIAKKQHARDIFLEIGRGRQIFSKNGISLHLNLFTTGRVLYKKFPYHEEWKKLPVFVGGIFGTAMAGVLMVVLSWIIPWTVGNFKVFTLLSYVMQMHILFNAVPHQLFGKMSDGKRVYTMYKDLKTRFNFQFRR
ncbi:MAG: hypothetical protein JXO44_02090 [Clostridia bacterium]|nr:hypothetical protein [Clostridia bacterium]